MPSVQWKIDSDKLRKKLADLEPKFLGALGDKLGRMSLQFISDIQTKYMNFGGRKSPIVANGTRVITGMLKRNWFNQLAIDGEKLVCRVFSTTPYAPVHIYGGDYQRYARSSLGHRTIKRSGVSARSRMAHITTMAHMAHYPARLAGIPNDWNNQFIPAFRTAMHDSFQEAKK